MKLHKTILTVLFALVPLASLIAGPKEDYDKVGKDLKEASSLSAIASKAWFDYKKGKTFPAASAEESKKVTDARRKYTDAKKNHPDLVTINKEVAAAQEKYGNAKKAKVDAMAKKASQEELDALKTKEGVAKKAMYTTRRKQSGIAKNLSDLQKLNDDVSAAAIKAEATRYASDPQAKSLFSQKLATAKKRDDLDRELKALKAKMK